MPQIAEFESMADAARWRAQHGGWIFAPDAGRPIWFALGYRPSAIMTHRVTAGLSGRLL